MSRQPAGKRCAWGSYLKKASVNGAPAQKTMRWTLLSRCWDISVSCFCRFLTFLLTCVNCFSQCYFLPSRQPSFSLSSFSILCHASQMRHFHPQDQNRVNVFIFFSLFFFGSFLISCIILKLCDLFNVSAVMFIWTAAEEWQKLCIVISINTWIYQYPWSPSKVKNKNRSWNRPLSCCCCLTNTLNCPSFSVYSVTGWQ